MNKNNICIQRISYGPLIKLVLKMKATNITELSLRPISKYIFEYTK